MWVFLVKVAVSNQNIYLFLLINDYILPVIERVDNSKGDKRFTNCIRLYVHVFV